MNKSIKEQMAKNFPGMELNVRLLSGLLVVISMAILPEYLFAAQFSPPPMVKPAPGHLTTGTKTGSCIAEKVIGNQHQPGQSVYTGDLQTGEVVYTGQDGETHVFRGKFGTNKEGGVNTYYLCVRQTGSLGSNKKGFSSKGRGGMSGMAQ